MADATESQSTGVFAIVELLELVLLNLDDPITLFAIQRVCKQWKYLIADSHRLQERMFLRAPACNDKPKTENQPSTSCPTTTILPNHSAWDHYKHDNSYHNHNHNDSNENENDTGDIDASSILLSPILQPNTLTFPTRAKLAVTCDQTALLSGHRPSWHDMYLSFPACKSTTVALWWTLGDSMRGSVYLESLAGGDGLRFRDVVEAALATRTGKWKRLPVGEVLQLKDVSLGEFLERVVREEGAGEEVEATSMFVMSF